MAQILSKDKPAPHGSQASQQSLWEEHRRVPTRHGFKVCSDQKMHGADGTPEERCGSTVTVPTRFSSAWAEEAGADVHSSFPGVAFAASHKPPATAAWPSPEALQFHLKPKPRLGWNFQFRDFPGAPSAKTLWSHSREPGLDPWSGK